MGGLYDYGVTIVTARKRSLGKGNIFTSACHSFCPHRGSVSRGVCLEGGSVSGGASVSRVGCASRGSSVDLPPSDTMGYGQQAGGTHPTEINACLNLYFVMK